MGRRCQPSAIAIACGKRASIVLTSNWQHLALLILLLDSGMRFGHGEGDVWNNIHGLVLRYRRRTSECEVVSYQDFEESVLGTWQLTCCMTTTGTQWTQGSHGATAIRGRLLLWLMMARSACKRCQNPSSTALYCEKVQRRVAS